MLESPPPPPPVLPPTHPHPRQREHRSIFGFAILSRSSQQPASWTDGPGSLQRPRSCITVGQRQAVSKPEKEFKAPERTAGMTTQVRLITDKSEHKQRTEGTEDGG